MSFESIGELVTETRTLLNTIKGGAIGIMQSQFNTLKNELTQFVSEPVSYTHLTLPTKA